jgi:hypothetical protein
MWLDKRFRKYADVNVEHEYYEVLSRYMWTLRTMNKLDIDLISCKCIVNEHVFFSNLTHILILGLGSAPSCLLMGVDVVLLDPKHP